MAASFLRPPTSTSTGSYMKDDEDFSRRNAQADALSQRIETLARLNADWDDEGAPAPAATTVALAQRLLALCIELDYLPERYFAELEGGLGATFVRRHVDGNEDQDAPAYATIGFGNDGSAALVVDDRAKSEIIAEDIATDDASLRTAVNRLKSIFDDCHA